MGATVRTLWLAHTRNAQQQTGTERALKGAFFPLFLLFCLLFDAFLHKNTTIQMTCYHWRERIKNWEIITSRRLTTAFKNIFINKHIRLNPTLDCLLSERNNWFYNMFGHKTFICFSPNFPFWSLNYSKIVRKRKKCLMFFEVEMDAVRLSMVNEWIKEEKFRFTEEENNDYGSQMIVIDDGSHSLVVRLSDVYMETLLEMLKDSKTNIRKMRTLENRSWKFLVHWNRLEFEALDSILWRNKKPFALS